MIHLSLPLTSRISLHRHGYTEGLFGSVRSESAFAPDLAGGDPQQHRRVHFHSARINPDTRCRLLLQQRIVWVRKQWPLLISQAYIQQRRRGASLPV